VELQGGRFWTLRGGAGDAERVPFSTGEGEWIFVLALDRTLYCHRKQRASFHHTSFLAGGACLAAGSLSVADGVLQVLYPHSGHYRPGELHLCQLLLHLQRSKLDLTTVSCDAQHLLKVARGEGNANKKSTTLFMPAASVLHFLQRKAVAVPLFEELVARTNPTQGSLGKASQMRETASRNRKSQVRESQIREHVSPSSRRPPSLASISSASPPPRRARKPFFLPPSAADDDFQFAIEEEETPHVESAVLHVERAPEQMEVA